MATVELDLDHSLDAVFAALIDPDTYPHWLVGAQAMREIDDDWPQPGSSFHHRVGLVWPLTVDDSSTVRDIESPDELSLEVRARPFGRAAVTFELDDPDGGGRAGRAATHPRTRLRFREEPIGMAKVLAPVLAPITIARNRRSLRRLADYLDGTGTD